VTGLPSQSWKAVATPYAAASAASRSRSAAGPSVQWDTRVPFSRGGRDVPLPQRRPA
jgi:hypothetical protein